jgi:hypothetical protein
MVNLSSSSCTSCESHSCIAPESDRSVIAATRSIGTINSIGITTSYTYTNMKGVFHENFLMVFLYAHNIVCIFKSQSYLPTLKFFVIAFSKTLLNASTMPFTYGWYGVLLWWWIWNSLVKFSMVLLMKCVP